MKHFLARLGIVVGWTSLLYVFYQLTNRFPQWPPRELPLTLIDQAIPFWTWTVVPYFVLIGGMYLIALVRDARLFRTVLIALTIADLLNTSMFFFFPTAHPRPPMPPIEHWTDSWYAWLTSIDTPLNCFPSGHITAPALGCWALAACRPQLRWVIWPAFALIAPSVLTTKQHYAVDILGGLTTAWLGLCAARWIEPRVFRAHFENPASTAAAPADGG